MKHCIPQILHLVMVKECKQNTICGALFCFQNQNKQFVCERVGLDRKQKLFVNKYFFPQMVQLSFERLNIKNKQFLPLLLFTLVIVHLTNFPICDTMQLLSSTQSPKTLLLNLIQGLTDGTATFPGPMDGSSLWIRIITIHLHNYINTTSPILKEMV